MTEIDPFCHIIGSLLWDILSQLRNRIIAFSEEKVMAISSCPIKAILHLYLDHSDANNYCLKLQFCGVPKHSNGSETLARLQSTLKPFFALIVNKYLAMSQHNQSVIASLKGDFYDNESKSFQYYVSRVTFDSVNSHNNHLHFITEVSHNSLLMNKHF